MSNNKFFLCDGSNPTGLCRPEGCYINGGECRHTTREEVAINPPNKRIFERKGEDLCEIDSETLNEGESYIRLTEIQIKYLKHLLDYAAEELYVYSSIFLREFNIELENVDDFIENLQQILK